jgi:phosphoglycolate phosphatase
MPIKFLIFDLDGTLADTLADLTESCNNALAVCGFPPLATDDMRKIIGHGRRGLVPKEWFVWNGGV